jgi:6-pyruvoyltetrahydropterin/6-carboxytetrahydropterin synthase
MHGIRITDEKMSFSAAHFVMRSGACERLHGHNYQVEVSIQGPLDDHGMVLDFRDVRDRVTGICESLDHRVLLPGRSKEIKVREVGGILEVVVADRRYVFPKDDCIMLPVAATTTELLAEYIATRIELSKAYGFQVCVSEKTGSSGCYNSK